MESDVEYPWMKLQGLSLEEQQQNLEKRREEIIKVTEESQVTDSMKEEWNKLVFERDRILKLKVKRENEGILQSHMVTLFNLLLTIGHFDHSSTDENLKFALGFLFKELSKHLGNNDDNISQDGKEQMKNVDNDTTKLKDPEIQVPIPPTPPSLPSSERDSCKPLPEKILRLEDSDIEESNHRSSRKKPKVRSPLVSPGFKGSAKARLSVSGTPSSKKSKWRRTPCTKYATPKRPESEDLRRCLLSGREKLKSTPGIKKSPGGTPERSKLAPPISDNANDIMSAALMKKFFSVRRLYASPIKDLEDTGEDNNDSRESSFNLSID